MSLLAYQPKPENIMNIGPVTDEQLKARRARRAAAALVIERERLKREVAAEARREAAERETAEYEGMIATIATNAIQRVLGPSEKPSDDFVGAGAADPQEPAP